MNGVNEQIDVHQDHGARIALEVVGELTQLRQVDSRLESKIMCARDELAHMPIAWRRGDLGLDLDSRPIWEGNTRR